MLYTKTNLNFVLIFQETESLQITSHREMIRITQKKINMSMFVAVPQCIKGVTNGHYLYQFQICFVAKLVTLYTCFFFEEKHMIHTLFILKFNDFLKIFLSKKNILIKVTSG